MQSFVYYADRNMHVYTVSILINIIIVAIIVIIVQKPLIVQ